MPITDARLKTAPINLFQARKMRLKQIPVQIFLGDACAPQPHTAPGGGNFMIHPHTDQSALPAFSKVIPDSQIHQSTDDVLERQFICILLTGVRQYTTCCSAYCRITQ